VSNPSSHALAAAALCLLLPSVASAQAAAPAASIAQLPEAPVRTPDVVYVPTPQTVVDAMLKLAKVTASDVVYDLGCGDGRIVITAARQYGARGVGIDVDPARIKEARQNAVTAGVSDKVTFLEADLFQTDISRASVLTLYLLPSLNRRQIPKILKELKPGTRIVSHAFDMGDWAPEQQLEVDGRQVYFWTVPAPGAPGTPGVPGY
jgi:SAM-dependent methyltransferase